MSEPSHEISQRDLRTRPAGHRPVSRADFAAVSPGMPRLDDRDYRRDMDGHVGDDPFAEFGQ